ncbi:NAD+ synthase [Halarchaeum rubridurum]|uniref:NH(3)-dependent NAD(+) synthetase n=1 Tax=Halarchaeum rubridurum TaxID=489911 RepID=A0A8T4GKS0_9EURY|nr:NAD+ synthase [Halarchaeum rubridurum]MBP1953172.1 NAD+ synthase [Halarchaeum rubridurum]
MADSDRGASTDTGHGTDPTADATRGRIDPDRAAERITAFLRDGLADTGANGYVVGVSGGLDSAVGLRLAVDAVGPERVHGLVLPGAPSDPQNMVDARDLCESLGVDYDEESIEAHVEAVRGDAVALDERDAGNVRARARMLRLYAAANARDLLVLGPDNRSEHLLGYFTKGGDGVVDRAPLCDLYKTEVVALAEALVLDPRFVEKEPTAGLWAGQTDREELGAPYSVIDPVLRCLVDDGLDVDATAARVEATEETVARLADLHEASAHKRRPAPTPGLR